MDKSEFFSHIKASHAKAHAKVHTKGPRFCVIVKPNASKTEIIGYDTTRQAFRMNVAAPADNNKANKELLKFIQKLTHMKARIASGAASKEKRIQLL